MKRAPAAIFSVVLAIALAIGGGVAVAQQVVRASGVVANFGDTVSALCNGGQSSADVSAGSGFTGTLTVYTAANIGSGAQPSPGPTSSPDYVNAPGGTTYQQTLSTFPGHLHVTLGSSAYVFAVATAASGGSTTVYITCSAAVSLNAVRGGGGGGNAPSPLPSAPIAVSASSPPTISLSYDPTCFSVVAGKLTSICTPAPQDTTAPNSAGCIAVTGPYPHTIDGTGCASLTTANAFTQAQSIEYNATTNCAGGVAIAELCITGTSTIGFLIGPASGVWTGGSATANSQELTFCKSVTGTVACPENIFLASGGTLTFNGGSTISTANAPITVGTGNLTSGKNFQGASCSFTTGTSGTMPAGSHGCKITIPSSPFQFTLTYNTGTAYGTQGICLLNDETTRNGASVTTCGTTSAVITGTVSGDIVDFELDGI